MTQKAKNNETKNIIMIDGVIYAVTSFELDQWMDEDPEFFDLSSPNYGKPKKDRG